MTVLRKSIFVAFAAMLTTPSAHATVFAGEVRALDAQPIFTPPSNSSPVVLRYYVADGTQVKAGDVVLRIDASQAAQQVHDAVDKIEQAKPKIAKEVADLDLKAADAELAAIDAQAALDTAKVDAALPRRLISALDYDKYQAEQTKTARDAALKLRELDDARAAVARRRADGEIELQKLFDQRDYYEADVATAEVRAERAGVVVHGFSNFSFGGNDRGRIEEGSSSYPGNKVGEIVGAGAMAVRAFVIEADHGALKGGDQVGIAFDALPGVSVPGTIASVAGASDTKPEWGGGRYFTVEINLDPSARELPLKPGMSVRIETGAGAKTLKAVQRTDKVEATGEVYARVSAAISPPSIERLWQLSITQMAGDGAPVKKDEVIVTFDGGDVPKELSKKQSELQEKLRTQEKLRLELAEKARTEGLKVAEAHADMVKAQRKADQPQAIVPGVEYKKLVIARHKAEQREAASARRERIAAQSRVAEQQLADADVTQLKADVARLSASMQQLMVKAPRDGILLHATSWRGEKVDVGSQVWRGMSVGEIPDTSTLAVRASLPEADLARVTRGEAVKVVLEGGSAQSLSGKVEDIGLTVHSKSRIEPVPVVEVIVTLEATQLKLKPGQPVRVEFANKEVSA